MLILIDEEVQTQVREIEASLASLNLQPHFYGCTVNRNTAVLNEISQWARQFGEEIVVITNKEIAAQAPSGIRFAYNGIVDGINGHLAIVKVDKRNKIPLIPLIIHEVMHLQGAKHCSSPKCLMSITLRNGRFTYGLESNSSATYLCENCRGKL